MDQKLSQLANLSQKDKAPAYLSLLSETLTRPDPSAVASDIHILVDNVVNQDNAGLVVGRQVIAELVKALGGGAISDAATRKAIVEDTLDIAQTRLNSYEEQVCGMFMCVMHMLTGTVGQCAAITACRHSRR